MAQVKILSVIDDTAAMDRSLDTLAPLEIELEKVIALGGRLSVVVIPREYAEKALKSKRGIDTTVIYKEYVVIGVFGADADEANGMFLSVPKGMAVYPRDGSDIQRLFFEAVERLRHSRGSSPWVTQLWDSIRDMKTSEEDTESRFISSSFYQFYAFIADHPAGVSRMLHDMTESERHWIMDFLPYDIPALVSGEDMTEPRDFSKVMDQWQYKDRMLKKQENGKITLRRFRNVEHLFTLPSISKEIMDLAGDPLLAASRMAKIIEKDPVLTSRLLKVVNSAFYGFRRQIDSVEHAVVILGNEEVVNLAFSIAVHKVLDNVEPLRARNLWEHSLFVAHLTSWLGPIFGSTAGNMLYTVGLLHDFGKIIFLQRGCYNNDLKGVSSLKDLATEEEQTGLSHGEMGAYVAERWNLPEGIVDGLISHHLPGNARDLPSAVSLHAADIMAHTGRLDVTMMNTVAAEFLRTSNGAALTAETIEEKYTDTAAKVKMLLDV